MAVVKTKENILEFQNKNVPISIMDTEHHGKVWLHSHSFFEIVYIDKGFSMHSCNDETTILTSGDLFAIRPGEVHAYISAHHTYLYNCLFNTEALEGVLSELVKLPGMNKYWVSDNQNGKNYIWTLLKDVKFYSTWKK